MVHVHAQFHYGDVIFLHSYIKKHAYVHKCISVNAIVFHQVFFNDRLGDRIYMHYKFGNMLLKNFKSIFIHQK